MDRLLVAILGLSFIVSGAGLTSALMLGMLFAQGLVLDHVTLFALSTLLTYYFYGFLGMFYVGMCSLVFIGCGAMYWYEMSIDDIRGSAESVLKQEQLQGQGQTDSETESQSDQKLNDKFKALGEYKTRVLGTLCEKTGWTPEHAQRLKTYYSLVSLKFNKLCEAVYQYMCKFRTGTQGVPGFRSIYSLYDQGCEYKKSLESVRSLHKLSRNMQNAMSGGMGGTGISPSKTQTQSSKKASSKSTESSVQTQSQDLSQDPMAAIFGSMSPDDMKAMESMMSQMMSGVNLDDFAKMMGGLEGMDGMDGISGSSEGTASSTKTAKKKGTKK